MNPECPGWRAPGARRRHHHVGAGTASRPDGSILGDGPEGTPGSNMVSFNHYAYSAVAAWLYRTVAGLARQQIQRGRVCQFPAAELTHAGTRDRHAVQQERDRLVAAGQRRSGVPDHRRAGGSRPVRPAAWRPGPSALGRRPTASLTLGSGSWSFELSPAGCDCRAMVAASDAASRLDFSALANHLGIDRLNPDLPNGAGVHQQTSASGQQVAERCRRDPTLGRLGAPASPGCEFRHGQVALPCPGSDRAGGTGAGVPARGRYRACSPSAPAAGRRAGLHRRAARGCDGDRRASYPARRCSAQICYNPAARCPAEAVASRQAQLRLEALTAACARRRSRRPAASDDHSRQWARVVLDGADPGLDVDQRRPGGRARSSTVSRLVPPRRAPPGRPPSTSPCSCWRGSRPAEARFGAASRAVAMASSNRCSKPPTSVGADLVVEARRGALLCGQRRRVTRFRRGGRQARGRPVGSPGCTADVYQLPPLPAMYWVYNTRGQSLAAIAEHSDPLQSIGG